MKKFRYFLYPLSVIYGSLVAFRNWLYDKKILKSATFNFPIICVGNLATGGTGKTPMTEYLVGMLKDIYPTATLSRGYKRKTKGFAIADSKTTALDIGDEPMQFHQKFPEIVVAVGEERLVAIPQILHQRPETRVIILDDAFQHRHIKAGLNLLLTEYENLYSRDLMLPAGNLRDIKSSARRAEIVIVTKCKPMLTDLEKDAIAGELHLAQEQKVFFTGLKYGAAYHLFTQQKRIITNTDNILLICGIANPAQLTAFVKEIARECDLMQYADHHIFSTDDLKEIKNRFEKPGTSPKIILTTEKDAVRLQKFRIELENYPLYVLPVEHEFLFNDGQRFNDSIGDFIESFQLVRQDA